MKNSNEEYLSKKRALELWDKKIIDGIEPGTFEGLAKIHSYLFQDVFDFAGKIRNVNISKGNFRFAPVMFIDSNIKIIEKMPENTFEEIIEKYVEMNVVHPFLEGNGRSARIWLDLMLKNRLGKCIDWDLVDKNEYLSAMERSPVNSLEIKHLLKACLTDKINDRNVYMRGIQKSYIYENLYEYEIYDIENSNEDQVNK